MSYSRTLTITTDPINLTAESLKAQVSRIRDILDPLIAREGADILHPDEVLTLHELFISLGSYPITVATLKHSRIHHAVLEVCGKATRWPRRLIDECDKIVYVWTQAFGPLKNLGPYLFEPGGRLWGVCQPGDLTRDALLKRWKSHPEGAVDDSRALRHGSLGFEPGRWWLNGLFAFHDGIIDLKNVDGGICADKDGAYAIVMKGSDELVSGSPNKFTYKCKPTDSGRFRLTAATSTSRYPVRVLRSHTLSSLWAPKTGIRYDGLYRVVGWTIRPPKLTEDDGLFVVWEVALEREPGQVPMEDVLKHPLADEVDDYLEYKRIRGLDRNELKLLGKAEVPRSASTSKPNPRRTPLKLVPPARAPTFVMPDWDPKPPPLSPTLELPRALTRHVTAREGSPVSSAFFGPASTSLSKLEASAEIISDEEASPTKRSKRVLDLHRPEEPANGSFDGQMEDASLSVHPGTLVHPHTEIWCPAEPPQLAFPKSKKRETYHWDRRRRDTASLLPEVELNGLRQRSVEEHLTRLWDLLGDFRLRASPQRSSGNNEDVGLGSTRSSSGLLHKFRQLVKEQDQSNPTPVGN